MVIGNDTNDKLLGLESDQKHTRIIPGDIINTHQMICLHVALKTCLQRATTSVMKVSQR